MDYDLMRRYIPTIALVLVAIILAVLVSLNRQSTLPASFTVNNTTYKISAYALTQAQQAQGLMNTTVTNSTFMLFVFSSADVYPFWMKNTYSALDIIWIRFNASTGTGNVVYIANAVPCVNYSKNQSSCIVYSPNAVANFVLEARAGFAKANNIGIGAKLRFS